MDFPLSFNFAPQSEMNLIVFSDDMRVRKNTLHGVNVRPQRGRALNGVNPSQKSACTFLK
jgi:hypothetical protein